MQKSKKQKRELATTNVRMYRSTREIVHALAEQEGKTMGRIMDEKFAPEKYRPQVIPSQVD